MKKKKGGKRVCCNCKDCKCKCHTEKDNFLGRVQLTFYEYPDDTHKVDITFTRYDDLPNPKENKRGFTIMGLMSAQIQDYAKRQMTAMDALIIGKREMQVMDDAAQKEMADVDRLQTKFDFETSAAAGDHIPHKEDTNNE